MKENSPEPNGCRTPRAGAVSRVALFSHPLHPMLVTFPIAFLSAVVVTDLLYWWTGDWLWAAFSFWLLVAGLATGGLASAAGFLDFLLVPQIRRYVSSWNHFLSAILMLALAAANLLMRWDDAELYLLPWGLMMSVLTWIVLAVAGWLGGKLVFEHNLGPARE